MSYLGLLQTSVSNIHIQLWVLGFVTWVSDLMNDTYFSGGGLNNLFPVLESASNLNTTFVDGC